MEGLPGKISCLQCRLFDFFMPIVPFYFTPVMNSTAFKYSHDNSVRMHVPVQLGHVGVPENLLV